MFYAVLIFYTLSLTVPTGNDSGVISQTFTAKGKLTVGSYPSIASCEADKKRVEKYLLSTNLDDDTKIAINSMKCLPEDVADKINDTKFSM